MARNKIHLRSIDEHDDGKLYGYFVDDYDNEYFRKLPARWVIALAAYWDRRYATIFEADFGIGLSTSTLGALKNDER